MAEENKKLNSLWKSRIGDATERFNSTGNEQKQQRSLAQNVQHVIRSEKSFRGQGQGQHDECKCDQPQQSDSYRIRQRGPTTYLLNV